MESFEPPLHIHSKEDETSYILEGELQYQAGEQSFHAKAGNMVYLPKHIPHAFKPVTDTVTLLLLMTPGGFEEMFRRCGRPAEELSLPAATGEKPPAHFLRLMTVVNEALGVTILPDL